MQFLVQGPTDYAGILLHIIQMYQIPQSLKIGVRF